MFQRIEAADAEQARLTVREDPDGSPRTLVAPDSDETSIQWFEPTWDGSGLVYDTTTCWPGIRKQTTVPSGPVL